jgi:hypothetical protein
MKKVCYTLLIALIIPLMAAPAHVLSASSHGSDFIGPLKPRISPWDDPNYIDIRYTHDEVLALKIALTGWLMIGLGILMFSFWFRVKWSGNLIRFVRGVRLRPEQTAKIHAFAELIQGEPGK